MRIKLCTSRPGASKDRASERMLPPTTHTHHDRAIGTRAWLTHPLAGERDAESPVNDSDLGRGCLRPVFNSVPP